MYLQSYCLCIHSFNHQLVEEQNSHWTRYRECSYTEYFLHAEQSQKRNNILLKMKHIQLDLFICHQIGAIILKNISWQCYYHRKCLDTCGQLIQMYTYTVQGTLNHTYMPRWGVCGSEDSLLGYFCLNAMCYEDTLNRPQISTNLKV